MPLPGLRGRKGTRETLERKAQLDLKDQRGKTVLSLICKKAVRGMGLRR